MVLREANHLNLHHLRVDGDSFSLIQCASGKANFPWHLVDIYVGVKDLSRRLLVSFNHIKHSANREADCPAKEAFSM